MRAFFALLLVIFSPHLMAQVLATLDRYSITASDTLNLTLEAADQIQQRPDLSALQQDFRILGSQRIVVSSHSSASRDVSTRWHLQLRPLKTGNLTIPPVRLGDGISAPIDVTVTGALQQRTKPDNLFLDSLVSQDRVYSHAQLLYTARLFLRTAPPASMEFLPPSMPGALVVKLTDPRTYKTDRGGENWFIREQTFALFPSETGLHTLIGAEVRSDDLNFSTPLPERFEIEVLPPAHQNSRGYWLPAEQISLSENWDSSINVQPGESFVREITLTAKGLPADALPTLFTQRNDDYFAQKEDVSLTETQTPQGLVSTRTERIRIEPLAPGDLSLPAIDLNWWHTLNEKAETATLPAREVKVVQPVIAAPTPSTQVTRSVNEPLDVWLWVSVGLGLLCTATTGGWIHSLHQLKQARQQHQVDDQLEEQRRAQKLLLSHQRAERNTFQALAIACQQNDAEIARTRLIEWGQNFWPEHNIDSLEGLCEAAHSQTVDYLVLDLDQHLHQSPFEWQGDLLLEAVEKLRQKRLRQADPGNEDADFMVPLAS
ncbi:BatD family protein [Marinobacterium sp. AK62]|uniref:BatD family protein n=1 Tax=Marinobacterium alkalitolerans TaxID=1542925 RepID=A0ABS3ZCT5_9GAMM|nr:BatD family protein [Marinobacterium alkalitolerans]MBP0049518.1 BatD family protein [Marinobacterium alkalitolerans]